jgi:hypothetical protein
VFGLVVFSTLSLCAAGGEANDGAAAAAAAMAAAGDKEDSVCANALLDAS